MARNLMAFVSKMSLPKIEQFFLEVGVLQNPFSQTQSTQQGLYSRVQMCLYVSMLRRLYASSNKDPSSYYSSAFRIRSPRVIRQGAVNWRPDCAPSPREMSQIDKTSQHSDSSYDATVPLLSAHWNAEPTCPAAYWSIMFLILALELVREIYQVVRIGLTKCPR